MQETPAKGGNNVWKWICPANPTLIWEYHSFSAASESVGIHACGMKIQDPFISISPCSLTHKLVDDGEPCGVPNCTIPYIRDPRLGEAK